jgi:hypothetical protein
MGWFIVLQDEYKLMHVRAVKFTVRGSAWRGVQWSGEVEFIIYIDSRSVCLSSYNTDSIAFLKPSLLKCKKQESLTPLITRQAILHHVDHV